MLLGDGRPDDAVQIRRDQFAQHPTATAYRALVATSATIEADHPAPWALAILIERVARQPAFASELFDVLLSLGRADEAWQLGQEHRSTLGDQQWLKLLEQRRTSHPADVVAPCQEMVERHILNSADKYRYRRAVALLPALRDAYAKAGDPAAFTSYLGELRARHTRRPTFLKTLEATDL